MPDREFLGYVLRAGGGLSGDSLVCKSQRPHNFTSSKKKKNKKYVLKNLTIFFA